MNDPASEQALRLAIGERIRRLRKARDLTQEQLAERVDAAPQTIRRIERGRNSPPLLRLLDIARALGVPLDALFENADADIPEPTQGASETNVIGLWKRTPGHLRPLLIEVMERFAAQRSAALSSSPETTNNDDSRLCSLGILGRRR